MFLGEERYFIKHQALTTLYSVLCHLFLFINKLTRLIIINKMKEKWGV